MNDWLRIRAHYRAAWPAILAAGKAEWALDPYAHEEAGVVFTPIEQALWSDIRSLDAVLYPQFPVGRRFVDFGNPIARVAIECDGAEFHRNAVADRQRQAEIESHGWTVYRFPGWECVTDESQGRNGEAYTKLREIVEMHGIRRLTA